MSDESRLVNATNLAVENSINHATIHKEGVFTSDELLYGQTGIDTTNNRLYKKYSDTQVIYFTGTVV